MKDLPEERLGELLAALPPAPPGWVEAAVELPGARSAIDDLVARALADRETRKAILADLESALRKAGVEPRPEMVDNLRSRLDVT
jgi:hypothetical protein